MSNASATTRPYFTAPSYFISPSSLAKKRLEEVDCLREEALSYASGKVDCGPACKEAMKLIACEAEELQNKIASLIASAEKLGATFRQVEDEIAEWQTEFEKSGEASENFTVMDAKVLVNQAAQEIFNWKY